MLNPIIVGDQYLTDDLLRQNLQTILDYLSDPDPDKYACSDMPQRLLTLAQEAHWTRVRIPVQYWHEELLKRPQPVAERINE